MNNEFDNTKEYDIIADPEGTPEEVPSETVEDTETAESEEPEETGKRKKKKRKKKHYLLKTVILIVVLITVYMVAHSELFTVKKIEVAENDKFDLEQIQEITGIKKNCNLFEIEAARREKALEEYPYVVKANFKRQLPDTVVVELELREEYAVLKYKEEYALIDKEGFVLEISEKLPEFPLLEGITVEEAKEGKTAKIKEEELYAQYMELLALIEKADMYFKKLNIEGKKVTAYARDKLYCTGTVENFKEGLKTGNLQAVFWNLMEKDVTKGVVTVGDDQYYSYNKSLN